ncbi:MAG: ATP-binding cassette domain-containing protein, partial [Chloroflexota bacterium]|nr:ATP-binding cassette domain-containing protein [Chloroflexota bacterium]
YGTRLNERGSGLSVGQKQLIALARAIAFDPEVLVVLDEATANIDSETEALIQDALRRFMDGRTSIVIAHRLSTIAEVDRILVMHHGQLAEQGTHRQLLAADGIYRRLWELQALEERVSA